MICKGDRTARKRNPWKDETRYIATVAWENGFPPWPEIPRELTEAEIAENQRAAEEWERHKAIMHPEEAAPTMEQIQKNEIDKILENWPWEGLPDNLVTTAPHLQNWKRKVAVKTKQSSRLLDLLNIPDYGNIIFPMIFELHSDACNFALTSHGSWLLMNQYIGYWDMNWGWFNHCELPRGTVNTGDFFGRPEGVEQILIVTPVREERSKHEAIYAKQLGNVYKLCQAVDNFADHFRILQLHRIPFLTPDLLALLIPKMNHLQVLGVYKCPLIHVGHTIQLLDIIKTERPQGKEVSFDFFPRFHAGPIHTAATAKYRTGNYGVTWDTWVANSVLAIWSLMTRILPRAVEQGVDLIGKDKMFRKWLEMTPCVNIDAILAAIMDYNMEPQKFVATVDYVNYNGSVAKLSKDVQNKPEGYKWMLREYVCGSCESMSLGTFYYYNHLRIADFEGRLDQRPSDLKCLGCMLVNVLNEENDHCNMAKSKIVRKWLTDGDRLNLRDLQKAMNDYHFKGVQRLAHNLERKRQHHIRRFGYDKECEERQEPLKDWLKYPDKHLSPRYEDKIDLERPKTFVNCQFGNVVNRQGRWWGHGHGWL